MKCRSIVLVIVTLVAILLAMAGFIPNSCHDRFGCWHRWHSATSVRLAAEPAFGAHILVRSQQLLSASIGPGDFAAMGTATNLTSSLLDAGLHSDLESTELKRFRQKYKAALQHLFPFLSARYLRHHARQKQGLVIPCGNKTFQFAVHLIAAGMWFAQMLTNAQLPCCLGTAVPRTHCCCSQEYLQI